MITSLFESPTIITPLNQLQIQTYSFGKLYSQKCKLNFMILQTNLAISSIDYIGIMNQVTK